MARQKIVMVANSVVARSEFASILAEFDWTLETATSLDALARIGANGDVAAVVIEPAIINLPWKQALAAVQETVPQALIILCHGFSHTIDSVEASAAGAFHLLRLPFHLGEVRQSIGFVWAAKNRRIHVMPSDATERSRLRKRAAAGHGRSGANVA